MALLAHWKLDGDLLDASGNGHDGSIGGTNNFNYCYGRINKDVGDQSNGGLRCRQSGSNSHVVTAGTFQPEQFTLSFWFKTQSQSTDPSILLRSFISSKGLQISLGNNGGVKFHVQDFTTGTGNDVWSSIVFDKWYHFAWRRHSTGSVMYLNSVEISNVSNGASAWPGNPATLYIMGYNGGSNSNRGVVDDVQFHDNDIGFAAVQAIYNSGIALPEVYLYGQTNYQDNIVLMSQLASILGTNLVSDMTFYADDPANSLGNNLEANPLIMPSGSNGNNKTILFETIPSKVSTPGRLTGKFKIGNMTTKANLTFRKLNMINDTNQYSRYYGTEGSVGGDFVFEDCRMLVRHLDSGILVGNGAGGNTDIKNCTLVMSAATGELATVPLCEQHRTINNNLILVNSSQNVQININGGKNNTAFNYGSGDVTLNNGSSGNIVNINPNLTTAIPLTTPTELGSFLSPDLHLTASSTPCLDNADAATATATDIEGKART